MMKAYILTLAFAMQLQGGNSTTTTSPLTRITLGNYEDNIIATCNKTKKSGEPFDCHLVGKHTLDDVVAIFWEQQEARRAEVESKVEELKEMLKPLVKP
jgi:hypothetical protein